ncbi:GNAT family N-acetyltransferase [Chitinophaga eiseniae]|uniref:GNAT family N-acetyltransferase n=1 Tax=Chitinophaga eiseniae TaxID=634771 RepID=A0A847SK04_9BACT|nr:GNAT family N-acetyltransferase [Chitinophaga eiseniae]NLR82221.1 GNAT family N-acetyltransferase [Chitinophaga eiseniae]
MIHIRPATAADLPVLLEFEQGIVAAERPFDNTLKQGVIHYYDLAALIAADNAEVLVAEYAGEIIGSGHVRIRDAKPYQVFPEYAYLGFMYVVPEHRGKGVNRMIIEGLGAWAVKQGIRELRLDVYADNAAAVRAYEKFGFRQNLIEMRLPL